MNFLARHTHLPWLKEAIILLVRSGSHAYGLNVATSDEDFKGVAIPPPEYFHGFNSTFEQAEGKDPDASIYEIRKFFAMAVQANPNNFDVLFCDDTDCLVMTEAGQALREHRNDFLSLRAAHSFRGYAAAQWHRITPSDTEIDPRGRKLAMHAVRLLTMCREIVTDGKVIVKRVEDREKLLGIRNGTWTYKELIGWCENEDRELAELGKKCTVLPHAPDRDRLNRLCVQMVERSLRSDW